MSKNSEHSVKIIKQGFIKIIVPIPKPRNKNLPKGTQKHQDKRKKEKYKQSYNKELKMKFHIGDKVIAEGKTGVISLIDEDIDGYMIEFDDRTVDWYNVSQISGIT